MHSSPTALLRRPLVLAFTTLLGLSLTACSGSAGSPSTVAPASPATGAVLPAATLGSVSPGSVTVGTLATLTLAGTGFLANSVVQVNSAARATTYVSATQLTAVLTSSDVASEGNLSIAVSNADAGGGVSNTQVLQVLKATPTVAVPSISSSNPASVVRGTAGKVVLSGNGFLPNSVVQVNGQPRATTYQSATQLSFLLLQADVAGEGSLSLTVSNAAAGVSGALPLPVKRPLPTVTASTPATAVIGAGDVQITLTGADLDGSYLQIGASVPYAGSSASTGASATFRVPATEFNKAGSLPLTLLTFLPGSSGYAAVPTGRSVEVVAPLPVIAGIAPAGLVRGIPATLTLTGTGFLPSSRVQAGGSDRATTYVSSTQLGALVTAADVSADGALAISVTNASVGGQASTPVSAAVQSPLPAEFHAYGDSITYGETLLSPQDQSYPVLVARQYGIAPVNFGQNGAQTWQIFYQRVVTGDPAPTLAKSIVYSLMSGSNDAKLNGSGPQEDIYQSCREAILAWFAVPSEDRVVASDNAFQVSGGCVPNGGCGSAGSVGVPGLVSAGAPVYVWYLINERAAQGASFSISVDGEVRGTYFSRPPAGVQINKQTIEQAVGLIRIPVNAGQHNIKVTTATGDVNIAGFGTLPALDYGTKPVLLVGDFPNTHPDLTATTLPLQQTYSADIRAAVALLAADGVDVRLVPTRRYLLGQSVEYSDMVHPNALGHQHLAQAFADTLGKLGTHTGATVLSGTTTALPVQDMVNIAPTSALTYTLPALTAADRTITVFNRGTVTATIVASSAGDRLSLLTDSSSISATSLEPGHSVTFFPDAPGGTFRVAAR